MNYWRSTLMIYPRYKEGLGWEDEKPFVQIMKNQRQHIITYAYIVTHIWMNKIQLKLLDFRPRRAMIELRYATNLEQRPLVHLSSGRCRSPSCSQTWPRQAAQKPLWGYHPLLRVNEQQRRTLQRSISSSIMHDFKKLFRQAIKPDMVVFSA